MPKDSKFLPIRYTSRDFGSIKQDLLSYATRYYSDSFKDFSKTSFASLMIDTVAYFGDVMSFYLDYQVSEMFLDSTTEFSNIVRIGEQYGYKYNFNPVSQGIVDFYILVPKDPDGNGIEPDEDYLPVLRRGTRVASTSGVIFTLVDDIDFSNSSDYVVARVNDAGVGNATSIAVKASGRVVSGDEGTVQLDVGAYSKFQRVEVPDNNVTEIISVHDSGGNEYYEVDYLSQNVVYKSVKNYGEGKDKVPNILVPKIVPRRFITVKNSFSTSLVFGYGSEDELETNIIDDPKNVAINFYGRDYITDKAFDPSRIIETDKFGIAPQDTTLTIRYRSNSADFVNAEALSVNTVLNSNIIFANEGSSGTLNGSFLNFVRASLECNNPNSIVGDISFPTIEEMKIRIADNFAAQNRAVTARDYRALIYAMPDPFGAVKKCNIAKNFDSLRRSINVYVLSEGSGGYLAKTNNALKNNLKTWLSGHKMINDSLTIVDGKIVNLGIEFSVVSEDNHNKYETLGRATSQLTTELTERSMEMGEPFYITKVYDILRKVEGILDVVHVRLYQVSGPGYSDTNFSVDAQTSSDGRYINAPMNVAFEFKNVSSNVIGNIR